MIARTELPETLSSAAPAEKQRDGQSDDAVRIYLSQMAEYPLLSRDEELRLAKRVEVSRRHFRKLLLECDFVLRESVALLKRVLAGDLGFDRTVQVAVSDRLEKHHILGRLPHNVATLEGLLRRNEADYEFATGGTRSVRKRQDAWRRLARRRRRAVRLVEELGLRLDYFEPQYDRLLEMEGRLRQLNAGIRGVETRGTGISQARDEETNGSDQQALRAECEDLLRLTQHTPESLSKLVARLRVAHALYNEAKRGLSEGNLRLVVSIAQISQPRTQPAGLDSRRKRGIDAGRREIRASAGLQVLHLRDLVDSAGDHTGNRRPKPHDPSAVSHGVGDIENSCRAWGFISRTRSRTHDGGNRAGRQDNRGRSGVGFAYEPHSDEPP